MVHAIVFSTGLIDSDTSACKGWVSIGKRNPAIAASLLEWSYTRKLVMG